MLGGHADRPMGPCDATLVWPARAVLVPSTYGTPRSLLLARYIPIATRALRSTASISSGCERDERTFAEAREIECARLVDVEMRRLRGGLPAVVCLRGARNWAHNRLLGEWSACHG